MVVQGIERAALGQDLLELKAAELEALVRLFRLGDGTSVDSSGQKYAYLAANSGSKLKLFLGKKAVRGDKHTFPIMMMGKFDGTNKLYTGHDIVVTFGDRIRMDAPTRSQLRYSALEAMMDYAARPSE